MEKNELKKMLYREKPLATFESVSKKGIHYELQLDNEVIHFIVPLTEIGDATFSIGLQAQLLIRYIVN